MKRGISINCQAEYCAFMNKRTGMLYSYTDGYGKESQCPVFATRYSPPFLFTQKRSQFEKDCIMMRGMNPDDYKIVKVRIIESKNEYDENEEE